MKPISQKLLSWLLCLCFMATAVPLVSLSAATEEILVDGEYEYTVSDNEATLHKYRGSATEITFPSHLGGFPVTKIGIIVFENIETRMNVTSITIPEGVTSTWYSFQGCFSLTNVTLPNSLTKIGPATFYCCTSLTRIVIPDGVRVIGESAFRECSSLTDITIPSGVVMMDDAAFAGCRSLREIVIPTTVNIFGRYVFSGSAWPMESPLSKLTIVSKPGSAAYRYAKEYGISFMPLVEYSTDTLGDINGDSKLDALDALFALQHSVRLVALKGSSLKMADIDQNGLIDAADALKILQHSVAF